MLKDGFKVTFDRRRLLSLFQNRKLLIICTFASEVVEGLIATAGALFFPRKSSRNKF